MKFDLKNSEIFNLMKMHKFIKLNYVDCFKNILLLFFVLLFEFSLHINAKKTNTKLLVNLLDAILKPDEYNLAEFLNVECAEFVFSAIKFCNNRKIVQTKSTVLLYSA